MLMPRIPNTMCPTVLFNSQPNCDRPSWLFSLGLGAPHMTCFPWYREKEQRSQAFRLVESILPRALSSPPKSPRTLLLSPTCFVLTGKNWTAKWRSQCWCSTREIQFSCRLDGRTACSTLTIRWPSLKISLAPTTSTRSVFLVEVYRSSPVRCALWRLPSISKLLVCWRVAVCRVWLFPQLLIT